MAYRIKAGKKDVAAEIRRIAAEEFALMRRALGNDDLAVARQVHEVRKSTKRLRSLLRLAGPVMPETRAENAVLRDSARSLSAARDSGAVLEALASLGLDDDTSHLAEAALIRAKGDTLPEDEARALLRQFGKDIRAASRRAKDWTLTAEGFEALSPGIRRGYRRLQASFAAALSSDEEEPLHDWRKRAKDHWHHALLLRRIHPAVMTGHARTAEEVSDRLGDWRDFGLLDQAISELPARTLRKALAREVREAAQKAQARSLKAALRPTLLLTAETPKALVRRWGAYWEAS